MKNQTRLIRILRTKLSVLMAAGFAIAMLCAGPARAQSTSTNWFINFDVPGGATINGWTNYFGPGAYSNALYTAEVVVTNVDNSLSTNIVNGGYYWNAIADNTTNSGSLLGDGVTPSPIVFANTDVVGAPGYSPIAATADKSAFPNYATFWALLLPYQHVGNNGAGGATAISTNTLYNVPAGTYDLYLYGINADPQIAGAYVNSQDDRGCIFTVWSDLTSGKVLSNVNTTNSFFVKGGNYVLFKNVVTSNGVISFSYTANTTVFAKYNGASKLGLNGEGDFNGLQLVFVSTNTTPIPSDVTFTNLYPNGNYQYQSSPTLSFRVASTNGIDTNQISISLSATMLGGSIADVGQSFTTNLNYITGGITISGDLTSLLVSTPLITNALYNAVITVGDLGGDSQTLTYSFDTIDTAYDYVFEAEDFNYGSGRNGGLFFDNPQTNAYAQRDAISGTDFINGIGGPAAYRSSVSGLATELCGDLPKPAYYKSIVYTNYDVPAADNVSNNWGNYTRTFPSGANNGAYLVYLRAASVGGQTNAASLSVINGTATTSTQSPTLLGTFSPSDTGGQQVYSWTPLLDSNGQRAVFIGGAVKTIRVTSLNMSVNGANANYSANAYLLVPVNTNTVVITNIYPDGATLFQATNTLSFTIKSTATVQPAAISVSLTGTNLFGQGFATNLTGVSGLTISGSSPSQTVTIPLTSNTVYMAAIQVTDVTGVIASTNLLFDTITPAYTFEAEDFDYLGGQFLDPFVSGNVDTYAGAPATLDIDFYDSIIPEATDVYSRSALATETCGDVSRLQYVMANLPDYDVANNNAGNWANYTRNYPAGTYNLFMRGASPGGATDHASLSAVTNGYATTDQSTLLIGKFGVPATGDYQKYTWAPLTDNGGNPVRVVLTGAQETLRVTSDAGGYNPNFYMLMPVDLSVPAIGGIYPNGAYQFQASDILSFTASSSDVINASGISVQLTGTNLLGQTFTTNITTANGLIVTGSPTSRSISLPLIGNAFYTAVITVTTVNNKTAVSTVSFDTVTPAFLFEAEDFDYDGGQFVNTAQTNGYAGFNAVFAIDAYTTNYNINGQTEYRTNGLNIEDAGDTARTVYATGLQDYDVANNNDGNWANYTRIFPSGVYNVYMRGANGANPYQADAASLSIVTGGTMTTNQTIVSLGTFSVPGITNAVVPWQAYTDVPLIDADGNYAQFVSGGQQTLRVTTYNGQYNANYYFLMPADSTLPINPPHLTASAKGSNVVVSFLTRTNTTYQMLFKSQLTDASWTPVGSTIVGNSLIESVTNTVSGSTGFYRLQTN